MDKDETTRLPGVQPGSSPPLDLITKNGIYEHKETGHKVVVLSQEAKLKGDYYHNDEAMGIPPTVVYTNSWFVIDSTVTPGRDAELMIRSCEDFLQKFQFTGRAPMYDTPEEIPKEFEERFQEELGKVFQGCLDIIKERKASYANSGLTVNDYMPFGHFSYAQMVILKAKRVESLATALAVQDTMQGIIQCATPIPGNAKKLDDLEDSLLDLINYAAFYKAWLGSRCG